MALGKGLGSLIPQNKPVEKNTVFGPVEKVVDNSQNENGLKSETQVWQIPISEIRPNEEQPRKDFSHEDLEDMVSSIQQHGVLQPITVNEKKDGKYELIAGERRLRASEIAGFATVPAIVRKVEDGQEKLELALIENIQRQDLNSIEEAFAFKRLIERFGLTQEEVAQRVGKKRPTIANTIRLLGLPEEIQKGLIDGKISMGKARALLSLKSPKEQWDMYQSMLGKQISVRDVEQAIVRKGPRSRKGSVRRDPNLNAIEERIEEALNTKVRITQRGERGSIVVEYYSKEEFRELVEKLSRLQ
ncbi:MAG: chromosome partitioning protein ParB [Candidatus Magasanikbacteria bacterium CG_4_9_14_3_um_filter_32_9]|uniref:Chromosome partitioning protein ParB n=1 Tax=Candidatus Magasanikbacteria bacterium CG_4_9_14_3_um_filter_32_9 TaxID=1974644 RepID=A0A2M7Z668_9BACT|nr:MAG: chromosome partitioning protein ParB [Candidatus Magasanikbacteria bacterium CG_4_9_14_3_um_filter_32_9]